MGIRAPNDTLIERLEAALSAADELADRARELNDGPNSKEVAKAIKAYRKAASGLDLRKFIVKEG